MTYSMTGFGSAAATVNGVQISVELKAVNHKFCELKLRLPNELSALEPDLARQVKETVRRGFIEGTVKRSDPGRSRYVPKLDLELARSYVDMLNGAADALGLAKNLGTAELAQVEGLVTLQPAELDVESARTALKEATGKALAALLAMREREGQTLAEDLSRRIGFLREARTLLAQQSPQTVETYQARLAERVATLAHGMPVDPQRLAQEVALFADRTDVAEELTRLGSHLDQFSALLASREPVGRQMDFLTQEIHREVNTIGSKSPSAEIAQRVVSMKAEVERIREQVQNVE